jgi:sterol desaturase/sphingolipid hydroxylase (fatty acid hydroxylase superfamily)
MDTFLKHASEVYAFEYFSIIIVVSTLEWVIPRRQPGDTLRLRWAGNIGITIIDTILVRFLFPMLGVGWAAFCSARGWGLFNQFAFPGWLQLVLTLIALDVVNYTQHYLLHWAPLLWRFHRTHHTDHDYDFTTGVRFHPLEAIFTTATLLGTIAALGAAPFAVLVSQLLSIAITFVEHANVRVPSSLDRVLRLFVVTPDMHRIHHSQDFRETESNFGTIFPWWDRLFGTYVDQPAAGHERIAFGLAEFGERKHLTLPWMLALPFLPAQNQERDPLPQVERETIA